MTIVAVTAQEATAAGKSIYKPGYTEIQKMQADGKYPTASAVAPPSNDNFANALPLGGTGLQGGTNAEATSEPGEPSHGAGYGGAINSVWFKHTAQANGVMTFRVADNGASSLSDSVVSAYTGSAVNNLVPVAESDDYPGLGFHGKVTFAVMAGQTYYIAVDGFGSGTGAFVVSYSITGAAANNNFDNAEDLSAAGSFSPVTGVTGSTVGATGEPSEPSHNPNDFNINSIWYKWTAENSGSVTFRLEGSSYDTCIGIYGGSAVNSLITIIRNDNFDEVLGRVTSQVTFSAVAGATYRIAIDGHESATGNTLLRWNLNRAESGERFDFNGDDKTDISIFRITNGQWWIEQSGSNNVVAATFGSSVDRLTPADFTGDGKVDLAFFRPTDGNWSVLRSDDSTYYSVPFGMNGDFPVTGKFDNLDNLADTAVFRSTTGTWYINLTGPNPSTRIEQFGQLGDIPVAADFDGDGVTNIAIYRPSTGQWWIRRGISAAQVVTFGTSTDKPVVGDYTGDGKADVAVFRPSTGEWFILRSNDSSYYSIPFGLSTDLPAPGDYDGDGKTDTAVFRPSSGTWYINRANGQVIIKRFGLTVDRPVPGSYIY